uniref:Obscurin n=2 Tax=Arion vulgaris TaxID=1028688 RepID=A0A0B7API1_9EUPU
MWTKVSESVSGTSYKVTDLRSDQDYMFRVRAYNDSGLSEPTLPVTLTHERTIVAEPRTMRRRSSVERFSSKERFASQERSVSMDRGSSVPRYLSRESSRRDSEEILAGKTPDTTLAVPEFVAAGSQSVQYAIDAQPVKISLQLRGLPVPTVNWYFKGKKIVFGDRYDGYVTPSGLVVLHFYTLTWEDIGEYKCVADNDQGQATFVVNLHLSDPPTFLEPIKDLQLKSQGRGQFTCRVDGIPTPTVRFMKDWKPLVESSRFKVTQIGPDQWSLNIEQAGPSTAGCYVCVAENAVGKVFSSARLSVDDDVPTDIISYKKTNFGDDYYVLEELGRGRYSTVRRVIERLTGREYAAKFTKVRDEADKDFFRLELDALLRQKSSNVASLHDAYESPHQLILVVELVHGEDLLERVTADNNWSEARAAHYVKLILLALKDIHNSGFLYLDLKPTDIRFSSSDDSSLKLIDFGFSRKLPVSKDLTFNYGTPEFCSPESISNEPVTAASDLWAVGVLTHVLLTGVSPFYSETTPEILAQIQDYQWSPDESLFSNLTSSAKDFISNLLIRESQNRPTLETCLAHDWLQVSETTDQPNLDISRLKAFHERTKAQQAISAVKTVASPVSLKNLLEGPTSIRGLQPITDPQTGQVTLPNTEEYGQFLDEESWYDWQTRHQQGIKTEVLSTQPQVKGYKKVSGSVENLAEESEEEDKERLSRRLVSEFGKEDIPPALEKELEWMEDARKQRKPFEADELSLASKRSSVASVSTEGFPGPLFVEKLHDLAFSEADTIILRCVITGPPAPTVVWYKNEVLLTEGNRLKMNLEEDGEATLTIKSAKSYDAGIYKCVGRNKFGRVSNRMRLQLGDVPGRPGQPAVDHVSSTDALILWEAPRSDGNSGILFYKLDYKTSGQDRWLTGIYTTSEAAVLTSLKPNTFYRFRVSATNRFGTSQYSWASVETSTKTEGFEPILSDNFFDVAKLKSVQTSTRPTLPTDIDDLVPEGEVPKSESEPQLQSSLLESVYNIGALLYKGKFSEEKYLTLPSDKDKKFVLRTVPLAAGLREYEILKTLRHEHVVYLSDAFRTVDYIHLVLHYREGEHIARHLSQGRKYTENTVASVIRQVLYGLEFLQRCNIVHLNLQPASIFVSKLEGCEIKLTDFSLAKKVSGTDGDIVPRLGFADFIPPEVVVRDLAGFPADIWGVGTLTFLLLSGVSPFHGDNYESTLVNIALNRYEVIDLYENITAQALKFIFKVIKRLPRNRPSLQDCLNHKWLQLTDQAIKERQDAIFLSNTLATFADGYDKVRQSENFRQSFEDDKLPIQMSN